jgi:hypothetical protein
MLRKLSRIVTFILILSAPITASPNQLQLIRHKNFLIKYEMDSEKLALQVVELLNRNLHKFEDFYNLKLDLPATIIIVESPDKFQVYTKSRLPEWTGAAFIDSENTILLKNPIWANPEINFKRDFLHELSHLFFQKKFDGKNIPLWYNEGLAEYLSGSSVDLHSGLVLSNAIWARTIIPLRKIDSLLLFSKRNAELAYVQSLSAVSFLQNELGDMQRWNKFHQEVLQSSWSSAFLNNLKKDEIDFEIAWYRYIEDKYRWLFILNLENLVWVALLLVLFLSMYFIRHRNRKILEEWEYEEQVYGFSQPYYSSDYLDYPNEKE